MIKPSQYIAQAFLYALLFVPLAYLTHSPTLQHLPEGMAELKLAVRHAGKIIGECTTLSNLEYANLPANMKRPEVCPRERSPLQIKLLLDDEIIYHATAPASGLHSDGVSSMYQRFNVPIGAHRLKLFMNDDVAVDGHTWELQQDIELLPAQVIVASFKEGFKIQ